MTNVQDVVIIGGGPAGSTAATFLAKHGHSVTVLEKEKFPREHVGESLLPFCYQIFEQLGVLDELSNRFVRKPGVRFIDVDGSHHTTWCFGHVIKDQSYLSFHVIRAEFDQLLLDNSRKHGATVKEQTRVRSVDFDTPDGTVKVHAIGPRGGKQTYHARFLLDASGRDTFLASRMNWKKPHKELDRAALSTHWTGAKYTAGIEEGLLQIVYLGGEKKGWIWVIPIETNRLSVGVVLNHAYIRSQKAKFNEQGVKDWQMALYRQELMSSDFVRGILTNAQTAQPLMFNGDYSYFVEKKYENNFAMIGDAGTFIDPIFASGVYLSINSARLVANALHEKFTSSPVGWSDEPSANGNGVAYLKPAYDQINGAYRLVDKAIRLFYNPAAINFAQVGAASELIHHQHENALALAHYLLAGDFFENHEKYSELIDLLQHPKMFESYKNFVMSRGEFQSNSCGLERTEIFSAMLADHEKRRAAER
jgi:flavin-dependent dehydrogenase